MTGPEQVDSWSRTTAFLTMLFNDQVLATGSGVLVDLDSKPYLLTALHNLSGREPTGEIKHRELALPNRVRIEGFHYNQTEPLYTAENDPINNKRRYLVHPTGPSIDVTLLPLNMPVVGASAMHDSFFDARLNQSMRLYVSQDCHIIGFPQGLVDKSNPNMPLAIWKTGHIASEPETDFMGEPVVIVDATTRPGMSGAPVIARTLTITGAPYLARLVGIYAGRVGMVDGKDSALGKVFKPRLVREILATK